MFPEVIKACVFSQFRVPRKTPLTWSNPRYQEDRRGHCYSHGF
jgi:hypothetical protein